MWGNETEKLDGTQLAADYTFSGLQKFGQGLEDRLRGLKLPSKLLEKVRFIFVQIYFWQQRQCCPTVDVYQCPSSMFALEKLKQSYGKLTNHKN